MGGLPSKEALASKFFDDATERTQEGSENSAAAPSKDTTSQETQEEERKTPAFWKSMTSGWNKLTQDLPGGPGTGYDPYELNRDVFDNNLEKLKSVWRRDKKKLNNALAVHDVHGLSPIHLAFRMGRLEYIRVFLDKADPKFFHQNTKASRPLYWSVLDEAVVLGNRQMIKEVLLKRAKHESSLADDSGPFLEKFLNQTGDVFFQVKWRVKSWVPLVSHFLPGDTMSVFKHDKTLRIDSGLTWGQKEVKSKGHTTLLYNAEKFGKNCFVIIDRVRNLYKIKNLDALPSDEEIEAKIDLLVSKPVESVDLSNNHMKYAAEMSRGKLKFEKIGQYDTIMYKWAGVKLTVHKRHEHLAPELVDQIKKRSKQTSGSFSSSSRNLKAPEETKGTFEEYMARKCHVGRQMKVITWEKQLKGSVAMASNFPWDSEKLSKFFKVESEDMKKLINQFAEYWANTSRSPPGHPVYIEIPVVATSKFYLKMIHFMWGLPEGAKKDRDFFKLPSNCKRVQEL